MERVFLSTDKGYLESVGKIIGDACNGLQSMYGVRLALPGAPPPPMGALLPLGGGSSDEAAVAFCSDGLDHVAENLTVEVAPEKLGVEIVSVDLIEVAVEVVETLTEGMAFLSDLSQSPLSDEGSGVTRLLEGLGHGEVLFAQALSGHVSARVSADVSMAHVLAGHEDAPGRRADRAPRVEAGEFHALAGHAVETGGLDQFLAEAAEIPVAEVVGHDEDQVGLGGGEGGSREEDEDKEELAGHSTCLP